MAHLVLLPQAWLEKCPHVLLIVCRGFMLGSLAVLKNVVMSQRKYHIFLFASNVAGKGPGVLSKNVQWLHAYRC